MKLSPPLVSILGCVFAAICGALSMDAAAANATDAQARLSALPLYFEANHGQTDRRYPYLARTRDAVFYISPAETITWLNRCARTPNEAGASDKSKNPEPCWLHLQFLGADRQASVSGEKELPGRINYFLGNDPAAWHTAIPTFEKVQVKELYPGIDLCYYAQQQQLEYDFVVAPNANPARIAFRFDGPQSLQISAEGDLVLKMAQGEVRQLKPFVYQLIDGKKQQIAGNYRINSDHTVGFDLGSYDVTKPLIIDPVLSFSTYLGGSLSDTGWDLALDGQGNIYVAGDTLSANLPSTEGAFREEFQGGLQNTGGDAFVAKLTNDGSALLYLTYLGGKANDAALGIAADSQGFAYVTGTTGSTNFPTELAISNRLSGVATNFGLFPADAFITKLTPDGSALVYSTFLGGEGQEQGIGIAVDAAGNAYVAGYTDSTNFPIRNPLNGLDKLAGNDDAFVTKISASGTAFVYSTYLGGTNADHAQGIAVDAGGTAFITGYTASPDFPLFAGPTNVSATMKPFQGYLAGFRDAFLTRIDPSGTMAESTYIGGRSDDIGFRIAIDADDNAYITGAQTVLGFPVTPGPLNRGGMFKTTNAAAQWTEINNGIRQNIILSLARNPASAESLYAGSWRGIQLTTNGGASWETLYDVVGPVRTLALSPTNTSVLFAGIDNIVNHLVFTGTNLTRLATNIVNGNINKLLIDPVSPEIMYVATEAGISRTTNGGSNWVTMTSGLGNRAVADLEFHPADPTTLYAGTVDGFYRTTNSAGKWTAFNTGLTNSFVTSVALDPVTPSTLYAGTDRGLFKSVNGGTNWTVTSLGPSNVTVVEIDPVTPSTLYVGTDRSLFKSVNGGTSWTVVTNGLGSIYIGSLLIEPSAPATIYAASRGIAAFGGTDAFVVKINPAGSNVYSAILGGIGTDQGWDIAVSPEHNAYVAGRTTSSNFPTNNSPSSLAITNSGLSDAFVTVLNQDASAYVYSTYLGGARDEFALGIEVDTLGNAYITGQTSSTNFPTTTNSISRPFAGTNDTFVAKISLGTIPSLRITQAGSELQIAWPAFAPGFMLESSTSMTTNSWATVPGSPVVINGWHTLTLPPTNNASFFRLRK